MTDDHYPTVDFDFFYQLILMCDKVEKQVQVGDIIAISIKGKAPQHKRLIYLKKSRNNQIKFYQATGTALRLGIMTELLNWYEANRNWKDGGYFEKKTE
jgi:hypothetical protein